MVPPPPAGSPGPSTRIADSLLAPAPGRPPPPGRMHPGALAVGIALRGQLRDRHIDEVRVPEVGGAVREGELHGLGDHVQARRRARTARAQIEGLEDVRDLDQGDASRGGRRKGEDLVAPVAAADRLPPLGLVALQVLDGEDPAPFPHRLGDGPGQAAPVEHVGALGGDQAKRPPQIRLDQAPAGLDGSTVGRKLDRGGLREELRPTQLLPESRRGRVAGPDRESLLGDPNCGLQHLGEGLGAEIRQRPRQPLQQARRRDGEGPEPGGILGEARLQVHVRGGRRRRRLPGVDGHRRAVGQPDQDEAAAADPGVVGIAHAQGEGGGDGCVDGVAARLEHGEARRAGIRLGAHHHAELPDRRCRRGPARSGRGCPRCTSRPGGGLHSERLTVECSWVGRYHIGSGSLLGGRKR